MGNALRYQRQRPRNGSIFLCFFQAEDGIRDLTVTGVQTCALPICQVSGDYFDYIQVDAERLGVAIADVSGKGVPASLIMAICRSVLRAEAARNPSPADVLRKVNRQLYPDTKEDMFISMAYLILDH